MVIVYKRKALKNIESPGGKLLIKKGNTYTTTSILEDKDGDIGFKVFGTEIDCAWWWIPGHDNFSKPIKEKNGKKP